MTIEQQIAETIDARLGQVQAAIALLDGGDTVPFISRYRKEATGGLSDTQLRLLQERLGYLRELTDRKIAIAKAIDEQGKLDAQLQAKIDAVATKSELEDLYLPYKKKRRTKGQMAIEAGLEPLADSLWSNPALTPESEAQKYVDEGRGVADAAAALDGARYILVERFAEDAALIGRLRELLSKNGWLCATVMRGKSDEGAKFSDYFDHQEPYSRVPGHRALAMFRGRSEGVLSMKLLLKDGDDFGDLGCVAAVASHLAFRDEGRPADAWRAQTVNTVWKLKLSLHLETDLFVALRTRADNEAIGVFAANMRDLLLAAPAGSRATLGLDPGYRSGVKVTAIDATGKVLDHATVYPHQPQRQWNEALGLLTRLCQKHAIELIAVGNGTASRETEKLAEDIIAQAKMPALVKVVVSEAGASVYSASEVAEKEFPALDVTIRGAISIARRLQDPLAELVKIDPKAIGVGQYQHDVSQSALARSLDATVEDCVNAVGVDLDTASSHLLSRVAGLSATLASNIVEYRDEHGAFKTRKTLKKVPRLGPKAFEQCAGFLRITNGTDPLDASGVHPESYPVVKRIVEDAGRPLNEVIGDATYLRSLDASKFTDEQFGVPTVVDIIAELEKPGRDPRPTFKTVRFADGVEKIGDLSPNQVLEGKVTNVTAFGAFVDVGVHQDGLVHISALSEQFVKDPREVVKAGDIVKVKVMNVDVQRQRIGLSMRLSDDAGDVDESGRAPRARRGGSTRSGGPGGAPQGSGGSAGRPQGGGRSQGGTSSSPRKNEQRKGGSGQNRQQDNTVESALALSLKAALEKR